jgi:hypothetical protein
VTEFKKGDRVKVEFEAVDETPVNASGRYLRLPNGKVVVSSEGMKITLIEPEYEDGAMYIDAVGDLYAYWPASNGTDFPWVEPGYATPLAFEMPVRPLRKLVPGEEK